VGNPNHRRSISTKATKSSIYVCYEHRAVACSTGPKENTGQALSIGHGATISQPYMVALMTELLEPKKEHRILEIGTGSGYQTAILAQLVAEVYSIEMVPELARAAGKTLRELGYANVTVRQGDGYKGWPEQAPFDGIMVTAAPLEVPAALIAQLSSGGRLVVPVGSRWNQELILIEKTADGRVRQESFGAVSFVPMEPADTTAKPASICPRNNQSS